MLTEPLAGQLDVTATELVWEQSMQQLLSESPELSAALPRQNSNLRHFS
ncbi:MAG: hypothetical protein H6822_02790 [Planctomycetaceae bacterium]|nr:hypothetical protein [Planctomycetales bacterium]MCB9921078.1 hypothetical protein [Planctomycetaceae bacterium]